MGKASRERKEKHELRELAGYRPMITEFYKESEKQSKQWLREILNRDESTADKLFSDPDPYPLAHFPSNMTYGYDGKPEHPAIVVDGNAFFEMLSGGDKRFPSLAWADTPVESIEYARSPFRHICIELSNIIVDDPGSKFHGVNQIGIVMFTPDDNDPEDEYIHCVLQLYTLHNGDLITSFAGDGYITLLPNGKVAAVGKVPYVRPMDIAYKIFTLKLLEFLNMRNVELIDGPPPPPRIQALHQKHYGEPLYSYKVLSVGHPRKEYTEDGDYEHGTHATPRGHIVRGHPRRVEGHPFIPDGVYWIPAHTRGDFTKGEVFKDYRIVTPDEDQD